MFHGCEVYSKACSMGVGYIVCSMGIGYTVYSMGVGYTGVWDIQHVPLAPRGCASCILHGYTDIQGCVVQNETSNYRTYQT